MIDAKKAMAMAAKERPDADRIMSNISKEIGYRSRGGLTSFRYIVGRTEFVSDALMSDVLSDLRARGFVVTEEAISQGDKRGIVISWGDASDKTGSKDEPK